MPELFEPPRQPTDVFGEDGVDDRTPEACLQVLEELRGRSPELDRGRLRPWARLDVEGHHRRSLRTLLDSRLHEGVAVPEAAEV